MSIGKVDEKRVKLLGSFMVKDIPWAFCIGFEDVKLLNKNCSNKKEAGQETPMTSHMYSQFAFQG